MVRLYSTYRLKQGNVITVLFSISFVLSILLLVFFHLENSDARSRINDSATVKLPRRYPRSLTFQRNVGEMNLYPCIMPVDISNGRVSSEFGMRIHPIYGNRRMHTGIDFAATTGTQVVSAADGEVIFAGVRGGYGNLVIIDHFNEYTTRYAHLSKINVHKGDYVKHGEVIGHVGMTGAATGPHLHYEVRVNGQEKNPREFLPADFEKVAKKKGVSTDVGGE
jgi:murein DD-endopeptidase MepM/ murein hydrolase activator NlpD